MIKVICGPNPKKRIKEALSGNPDWYWLVNDKDFNLLELVKRLPDVLIIDECSDLEVKKYVYLHSMETINVPIDLDFKTIFFPDTIVVVKNWPCQELIRDLSGIDEVELIILDHV